MGTHPGEPPDNARPGPVAQICAVRRRLAQAGPSRTRDAKDDFQRVTLPELDCDALRDALVAERATTVVEIGLAYGSSALAIGEALMLAGGDSPLHLVIDAFQESEYFNVGWDAIRAAGLDRICRLLPERSQLALPRLVTDGFTADAAFVDGSHIFDNVFVDLYFLREIVRPGGLIVLDDVWWPSVATAAHYYETNAGWEPLSALLDGGTLDPATKRPRLQAWRLPDPPFRASFQEFKPF
jgi:predicted O-methyltransferase YrrM